MTKVSNTIAKVGDNRTKVADSMKLLLHPTAVVLQKTTRTGAPHAAGTLVQGQWSVVSGQ